MDNKFKVGDMFKRDYPDSFILGKIVSIKGTEIGYKEYYIPEDRLFSVESIFYLDSPFYRNAHTIENTQIFRLLYG